MTTQNSKLKQLKKFYTLRYGFELCVLRFALRSFFSKKNGFTLLEMVISIGLFTTLVVASMGIIIGVSRVRQKSANLQAVIDNVRFSLELMTKELRTGEEYSLINVCSPPPSGPDLAELSFISNNTANQERRVYFLENGRIMKINLPSRDQIISSDCSSAFPFTSEEVYVNKLHFIVRGQTFGQSDGQPYVTVSIEAQSRDPRTITDTHLNLQTTITQRIRDVE